MLKNYLKIAFRSLSRRRTYVLINVIGLSMAMACSVFIYNWVADELSFDTFYPKGDRIYRVAAEVKLPEDSWSQAVTSVPLGPAFQEYFPEVEYSVRMDLNDALVEYGDKKFIEDLIILTDPSFYDVFDYELINGEASTSLIEPYNIVLTESMAKKYFGEESPLGKFIRLHLYDPEGMGMDYKVTGVIQDAPKNSHIRFNFLASFATLEAVRPNEGWFNNSYYTYVLLNEKASQNELEYKIPEFVEHHIGKELEQSNVYYRFFLQPVTNIYHHSRLVYEFYSGSYELIWVFGSIGIFVLILAGINYVNLATAFSIERTKEIGVRKVLGAFKLQLINQHLTETTILVILSAIFAGLMVEVSKPFFYELTGKSYLAFDWISIAIQLISFGALLIFLAGIFPARMLSRLNPTSALKTKLSANDSKFGFWQILVTFQFTVTLAILVGLLVVKDQMSFIQSTNLGYNKENLLVLKVNGSQEVKDGIRPFQNELMQELNVTNTSLSNSLIVGGLGNSNGIYQDEAGNERIEMLFKLAVNHDYLDTYEIPLVAGRNFSKDLSSDSTEAFIINQKAAEVFGWLQPEEAIGKLINFNGRDGLIIGVTKDFHFNTLYNEIGPVCIQLLSDNFSRISIRGVDNTKLLATAELLWQKHFPTAVFDYTFQHEALSFNYRYERKAGEIFNAFSLVSIVIAFLGLFGLVGFTVSRKTKEIGIRKVLGASVPQILKMISGRFIKLIVFAALIAFPFSWWLMSGWLNEFTFRTEMKPWFFLAAGLAVFILSITVIFIQAFKASVTNPVDALKEQ